LRLILRHSHSVRVKNAKAGASTHSSAATGLLKKRARLSIVQGHTFAIVVNRNLLFRHRFPRIVPLPRGIARPTQHLRSKNRAISCRPGIARLIESHPRRFLRHQSPPLSSAIRFTDFAVSRLVCRKRQHHDPAQHRREPYSRQVSFRQHQPVVPRMLRQPAAGLQANRLTGSHHRRCPSTAIRSISRTACQS